jgi:Zn-dependent M16 (insulinase) family peptidase
MIPSINAPARASLPPKGVAVMMGFDRSRHATRRASSRLTVLIGLVLGCASLTLAAAPAPATTDDLAALRAGEIRHGFRLLNLYENGAGRVVGARFVAEDQLFLVDLLRIQSVPQAFFWIKTLPSSDRGEPHACEHLLLGKGSRGRHAAELEDMALAKSTAYTGQTKTCYHFNTVAGGETFYEVFEAKLMAFVHPTFTDEEIRREVCHWGVTTDPQSGALGLEEKGTVYSEMVSTFEKPWYHVSRPLDTLVYGATHPLTRISGGEPGAMRTMTPEDLRRFHAATHHLSNMGAIVSIPDEIDFDACLARLDEILRRCQPAGDTGAAPAMRVTDYPPPQPGPIGTLQLVTYPSRNSEDPGYITLAWPSDLALAARERTLMGLFLDAFAGGETSLLYDLLIRSDTRRLDIGGTYVYGGVDREAGHSVSIGLGGLDSRAIRAATVDSVRGLIVGELRRLRDLPDGAPELAAFNEQVRSRLIEERKQREHDLDSPPMFGFRSGPAGAWLGVMEELEEEPGFRKSLLLDARTAYADSLLSLPTNIWRERIDRWQLLTRPPYAVAAGPSPDYLDAQAQARTARLAHELAGLRERFHAADDQTAIAAYRDEFDARTRELEAAAQRDTLPAFVHDPPLTLDDALRYETGELDGVPYLAATFESMTSSSIMLALRADVLPESLLVYAPILPSLLTEVGVVRDGRAMPYEEMREQLRREVLGLGASYEFGYETGRVELALTGQASRRDEIPRVIDWMETALHAPNLTPANLPRILDLIDQAIVGNRNRMKGREEDWVDDPALAYRFQDRPLFLATNSFLTQTHLLQRARWRLTDAGDAADHAGLARLLRRLSDTGAAMSRDSLMSMLAPLAVTDGTLSGLTVTTLGTSATGLSPAARRVAGEIAAALQVTLADLPEATRAQDWRRLCRETEADLMIGPLAALAEIDTALQLLRHRGQARVCIVSNGADRPAITGALAASVKRLAPGEAARVEYDRTPRILARLRGREPGVDRPVYAGLLTEGTRNGVLMFSARLSEPYDPGDESVLTRLAGCLYGGGGAHGIFMQTWAAGLAYSNGYSYSERSGRASYYAERSPDVAETMRFVVHLLEQAKDDPRLVDYAIAQVFGNSRAPSRYEARGRAMAADLTDGYTPQRVTAFRRAVLAQRDRPGLYEALKARMRAAYGPVLIGYGAPLAQSREGNFFLIGPETQFRSLEDYLAATEGRQTVQRLYPRDFWLGD